MTHVTQEKEAGSALEATAEGRRTGKHIHATKRSVLLRDGLIVLVLCLVTVALFGVTLFLFKSFEEHRSDLGRRWSARGRLALLQGRPEQAAGALRTALSYTPDDYPDQLSLAQALAGAGHLEAANNYFVSLWEVHPGDGFLNLQLARLARARGSAGEAINYYRASVFGSWEQNGVQRRREVRLELADYLAQRGEVPAAQAELLIAAGNAPERDERLRVQIADRLRTLGDLQDALHFYDAAAAQDPRDRQAQESAGRVDYQTGNYPAAVVRLTAAAELERHAKNSGGEAAVAELTRMANEARRIPELSLSRDLPAERRAEHLVLDAGIAQRRLKGCAVQLLPKPLPLAASPKGKGTNPSASAMASASPVTVSTSPVTVSTSPVTVSAAPGTVSAPPAPPAVAGTLAALRSRWTAQGHLLNQRALERDAALEDTVTQLIYDTEVQLAPICGAPTGDDALLLLLARKNAGGRS